MVRNFISLIIFAVLFFLLGSTLFSAIGKVFYWIADLVDQTGFKSVWDMVKEFFSWG